MKDIYNTLASTSSVTLYSYIDNLYIVGSPQEVIKSFEKLKQELNTANLE